MKMFKISFKNSIFKCAKSILRKRMEDSFQTLRKKKLKWKKMK
jgi:hypothetical protein